jgi:two-component system, cell cycle sensor histidine kinase and response regulator CckA
MKKADIVAPQLEKDSNWESHVRMANGIITNKPTNDGREAQPDLRAVVSAQKAELIGEFARAMANQINNIMMAVSSYAELELKKAVPTQKRSLEQVLSNATRATSLIQKLLAFSRKRVPASQRLRLNCLLSELKGVLEQIVGGNIDLVLSLDPNVCSIHADDVEIEQLVLILAINARDAMPSGGTLRIATQLVEPQHGSREADGDMLAARYAVLSVDDTRTNGGQNDEIRSTALAEREVKAKLAQAAIQGMIEGDRALLRFSAERESGGLEIYFPALGEEIPETQDQKASNQSATAKTILVVEDDDAVRMPTTEFLKMEGFKVLQARTGIDGIDVVLRSRSPLDLLITDIVMPKMTGPEMAEVLLEMHPHIKVLYMSGDADQIAVPPATGGAQQTLLQKPFRLDTLKSKILELFEQ